MNNRFNNPEEVQAQDLAEAYTLTAPNRRVSVRLDFQAVWLDEFDLISNMKKWAIELLQAGIRVYGVWDRNGEVYRYSLELITVKIRRPSGWSEQVEVRGSLELPHNKIVELDEHRMWVRSRNNARPHLEVYRTYYDKQGREIWRLMSKYVRVFEDNGDFPPAEANAVVIAMAEHVTSIWRKAGREKPDFDWIALAAGNPRLFEYQHLEANPALVEIYHEMRFWAQAVRGQIAAGAKIDWSRAEQFARDFAKRVSEQLTELTA